MSIVQKVVGSALAAAMILGISGCAARVNREVGMLNLKYQASKQENASPKTIAIIMPQFIENTTTQQQSDGQNSLQALMLAARANTMENVGINFNEVFVGQYRSSVLNAMQTDFIAILQNKGYNILGPYASFDDMPYSDKKKAYVAVVSDVSIDLQKKITSSPTRSGGRFKEEGLMQVGGELRMYITEPLTKERVMTKRINLSDFNIQKPYIYEKAVQSSGSTESLFNAVTGPSEIHDNTDKVLTEGINEFYAKSMQKIESYLSIEELSSYEEDINKLKELKRF